MAAFGVGFACVTLLLSMVVPSLATVYTVGGSSGWNLGVDYGTWASGKTFEVGDSLVFNYGNSHTVDEVSDTDYKSCSTANSIKSNSDGKTTVDLKTAGTHNFVCGVMSHCGSGMKLSVNVAAAGATTTPSSSGTPTPSTTPTTSTSKTPSSGTSTTTTTPATSSAQGLIKSSFGGALMITIVAIWWLC
ncbi:hypothetical protein ACFE04_014178 [Oxalis oulophora]